MRDDIDVQTAATVGSPPLSPAAVRIPNGGRGDGHGSSSRGGRRRPVQLGAPEPLPVLAVAGHEEHECALRPSGWVSVRAIGKHNWRRFIGCCGEGGAVTAAAQIMAVEYPFASQSGAGSRANTLHSSAQMWINTTKVWYSRFETWLGWLRFGCSTVCRNRRNNHWPTNTWSVLFLACSPAWQFNCKQDWIASVLIPER